MERRQAGSLPPRPFTAPTDADRAIQSRHPHLPNLGESCGVRRDLGINRPIDANVDALGHRGRQEAPSSEAWVSSSRQLDAFDGVVNVDAIPFNDEAVA